MTKSFGGTQRKMRNTSMVFKETDDGPFWMSMEECENTRLDKQVQDKVKTRTLPKKAEKTIIRK
jgi:hypothetical protein